MESEEYGKIHLVPCLHIRNVTNLLTVSSPVSELFDIYLSASE